MDWPSGAAENESNIDPSEAAQQGLSFEKFAVAHRLWQTVFTLGLRSPLNSRVAIATPLSPNSCLGIEPASTRPG